MATIIPEQMYISFSVRDYDKDTGDFTKLAFATYVENNIAFLKRKSTIDTWAVPYTTIAIDKNHPKWDHNNNNSYQHIRIDFDDMHSKTINNELLSGFKITQEVKRNGWNGGNVVWRILDPRGFELEISSANLAGILECTTIQNGAIQAKCKWGWIKSGGSRIVLLPENSQPYIEALRDTVRDKLKKIPMKNINIGDTVELKNGKILKYYGLFHYLTIQESDYSSDGSRGGYFMQFVPTKRKSHFFLDTNNVIHIISTPTVVRIINTNHNNISIDNSAIIINRIIKSFANAVTPSNPYCAHVIFVSPDKIDTSKVKIELVEISFDLANFILTYNSPQKNERKSDLFPVVTQDNDFLYRIIYNDQNQENTTYKKVNTKIDFEHNYFHQKSYYCNNQINIINKKELSNNKLYIITIVYNNDCYSPAIY